MATEPTDFTASNSRVPRSAGKLSPDDAIALPQVEAWLLAKVDAMMTASVEGGGDLGKAVWKFDSGIVDGIVNGIAWLASQLGDGFKRFQTGYARAYALMMLFGAVCVLGWFAYASFLAGGGR